MNTSHHDEARALHAHAAQVDAAKQRAETLRSAAIDGLASALLRITVQAWRRATHALPLQERASATAHHHPTKA